MMKKLSLTATTTVMLLASAVPAMASHPHVLVTPGTCVDRAGVGFGTGQDHDHTSFHERIHMGRPNSFAFAQTGNPVSVVGKTLCAQLEE